MYILMTCLFLTVSAPTLSVNDPDPVQEEIVVPTVDQEEEIISSEETPDETVKNALLVLVFGSGALLGSQFAIIFTKHFYK